MTTIYFQIENISKFSMEYYKKPKKIKLLNYNIEHSKQNSNGISNYKKDKVIKKIYNDVNKRSLCKICKCYIKNYKIHTKSKKHTNNDEKENDYGFD